MVLIAEFHCIWSLSCMCTGLAEITCKASHIHFSSQGWSFGLSLELWFARLTLFGMNEITLLKWPRSKQKKKEKNVSCLMGSFWHSDSNTKAHTAVSLEQLRPHILQPHTFITLLLGSEADCYIQPKMYRFYRKMTIYSHFSIYM